MTQIMLLNAHSANAHDVNENDVSIAPAVQQGASSVDAIGQVRELLYGDALRHHGRRVEDLSGEMRDLEQRIMRRLDEMQNTIDALARSVRVEQSNAVRNIGLALSELGRQIATGGKNGPVTGDARSDRGNSDANP